MYFRLGTCLCLLAVSTPLFAGGQTAVQNVRIWAAPDNTRVVFDIARPVEHVLESLSNPERLVIDIKNATLNQAIKQPVRADHYLRRVRHARRGESDLRVVLDLKQTIKARSFLLQPHQQYGYRLVVDLFDDQETGEKPQVITQDSNQRSSDVIIAIDPGHGGEDPGATGPQGVREKDITLKIAKKLAKLINRERGMKAIMTRESDYFLRLRHRIQKAREKRADLFVSIHADAFRDPRVRGSSVYILSNRGASSEAARWLAERENASDLIGGVSLEDKDDVLASVLLDLSQTASLEASIGVAERVLASLKKTGKTHKKRVQSAGFAVLKSPDIPSILVETAYISNPEEEKNLINANHQAKLARAMFAGLKDYFRDYAPEGTWLAAQAQRKHIIARGETLSGIAERYNITTATLRKNNQLKNDTIQIGQVLHIPTI